jgi:hypothetical protein
MLEIAARLSFLLMSVCRAEYRGITGRNSNAQCNTALMKLMEFNSSCHLDVPLRSGGPNDGGLGGATPGISG